MHFIIHVVVENQVAMGGEYVAGAVLRRLINEGLDRHQADKNRPREVNAEYKEKLLRLTAKAWLRSGKH